MRSLCNLVYAVRVQALESDAEQRAFDYNLSSPPGARERRASKGTNALMQAFSLPKAGA